MKKVVKVLFFNGFIPFVIGCCIAYTFEITGFYDFLFTGWK